MAARSAAVIGAKLDYMRRYDETELCSTFVMVSDWRWDGARLYVVSCCLVGLRRLAMSP